MFFSLPEGLKAWLIIKNTQETSVVGKLKPENKFRPELNGNRTHQLCTTGAVVLYQLRYQAHCELFTNHKMTSSQLAWSLTWKTTAPASQRGFQSRSSLFFFFFFFQALISNCDDHIMSWYLLPQFKYMIFHMYSHVKPKCSPIFGWWVGKELPF